MSSETSEVDLDELVASYTKNFQYLVTLEQKHQYS